MGNDLSNEVDNYGFLKDKMGDRNSAHEDCKVSGHLKPEHLRELCEGKSVYRCSHCGETYTEKSPEKQTPLAVPFSQRRNFGRYQPPTVQTPIEMLLSGLR